MKRPCQEVQDQMQVGTRRADFTLCNLNEVLQDEVVASTLAKGVDSKWNELDISVESLARYSNRVDEFAVLDCGLNVLVVGDSPLHLISCHIVVVVRHALEGLNVWTCDFQPHVEPFIQKSGYSISKSVFLTAMLIRVPERDVHVEDWLAVDVKLVNIRLVDVLDC